MGASVEEAFKKAPLTTNTPPSTPKELDEDAAPDKTMSVQVHVDPEDHSSNPIHRQDFASAGNTAANPQADMRPPKLDRPNTNADHTAVHPQADLALRKRRRTGARSVRIQQFIPEEDLKLGYRIAVLGQTGSGKSVAVWDLCHAYSAVIDLAIVMSPTAEENNYHHIVPRTCIYEDFDEDAVLQLIKFQKKCVRLYGKDATRKVLIILDDLAFNAKMFASRAFKRLIYNGRHAQITVIITSQFALNMPPPIRSQLQLTFTAFEMADNVLDRLHDNYFSIINRFHDFKRIMLKLTKNRQMLVVQNGFVEDPAIAKVVHWYKAPFPVAEFRLGSPELWELADQLFVDDEEEREEQEMKLRAIQAQIQEDKQPLYDIEMDTTRPRVPTQTLSARYGKRKTRFNVDPATIAPKVLKRLKREKTQPQYSMATARAYHSMEDNARKRMRKRYSTSLQPPT